MDRLYSPLWGAVKIVPPKSWTARRLDYSSSIDSSMITGPIEQNTYGKAGIYECMHIQRKGLTIAEYKRKVQSCDYGRRGPLEKVEEDFWKNLSFSPPLYGADLRLSLMDCDSSWNLQRLKSVLTEGLEEPLQGINVPYCYFGCWKSFFAWHTEDLELSGINFLHHGSDKIWYAIPPAQRHLTKEVLQRLFPEQYSKCPEFQQHKTLVVKPSILRKKAPSLKIARVIQKKG